MIRRGVKTLPMILRCQRCSGGSLTMRNGLSFSVPSIVTPPVLENRSQSLWAARTSAKRASDQNFSDSL